MYDRTYKHLERTGQIYQSQYGFRSKHSRENAISELTSEVIKNRDIGLHTLNVFLDISKAFDMLTHSILLEKMYRYGICGQCLNWYHSYLNHRQLRVKSKVGSSNRVEYSDSHEVKFGAPQGSCLGPLIFLIFSMICIYTYNFSHVFFSPMIPPYILVIRN